MPIPIPHGQMVPTIRGFCEQYLRENGHISAQNTCLAAVMRVAFAEEYEINPNTFQVTLSRLAGSPGNNITKPFGRHGYFLNEPEVVAENVEVEEEEPNNEDAPHESNLYPYFENWLIGLGYYSPNSNAHRKRRNGKWGNPDVVGIKAKQLLCECQVEICSIEVKKTPSNWRKDFFEAVAHKARSNRSYFAFPLSVDDKFPIDDFEEIKYYAERFRVGVVVVVFNFTAGNFPKGYLTNKRVLSDFANGEVSLSGYWEQHEVIEIIPAPYDFVPLEKLKELSSSIGVTSIEDLQRDRFNDE